MTKKSKIIILVFLVIGLGILTILGLGVFWMSSQSLDLSEYEYLKEPQITTKSDQKMIVIKVSGDPNTVFGSAIGELYQAFYQLRLESEDKQVALRARWEGEYNPDALDLEGEIGLPVHDYVTDLPVQVKNVELVTWKYGEVAEILHIGSYDSELPTVEKLKQHIYDSGYGLASMNDDQDLYDADYKYLYIHEEEYIKGPLFFWKGNPDKYYTIIRYPVSKHYGYDFQ